MTPPPNRAVMEQRSEAVDSLDFFPTPPWATRALFEHLGTSWCHSWCWEPCAGEGHMAEVLREYFGHVHASDVHDYGCGYAVGSFIGSGPDVAEWPGARIQPPMRDHRPDWIITNPPFNLAEAIFERAHGAARVGVALLLRTNWLDTQGRFDRVFSVNPPTVVLQFADRVPMVKGRWDPDASTATAYAWFVWDHAVRHGQRYRSGLDWIASGAPARCSRAGDVARFARDSVCEVREGVQDGQSDFWGK